MRHNKCVIIKYLYGVVSPFLSQKVAGNSCRKAWTSARGLSKINKDPSNHLGAFLMMIQMHNIT